MPTNTGPRRTLAHLLLLTLACLPLYFWGLTDHGLTNEQEMTRLTAAREMQAMQEYILPLRQGKPYIAKPPVMYWVMIGIAEIRGVEVGLFEVRLTVALGAWLGVLATYLAGRMLLRDPEAPDEGVRAALWGAVGLATGILYVRSGRIGELDILMIPTVTLAIACVAVAWRSHLERAKTHWPALLVATLCSAIAALTKGPIPTAVIGVGAYGAILAESVFCDLPRSRTHTMIARILAPLCAVGAAIVSATQLESTKGLLGVLMFALIAGALAWGVARVSEPARAKRWFSALARTHPVLVLGAGAGALWWWLREIDHRADPELIAELKSYEVDDNFNVLLPDSPVNNLEYFSYGLGATTIACLIALFWIARDRPRMTTGRIVLLTWALLGFVVFSTMGKGVARYLTPLWPAASMLGAWWLINAMRDIPRSPSQARAWRVIPGAILAVSLVINAWWYADGRDRFNGQRSPRDFVGALVEIEGFDPRRVGTFGYETPGLDYYMGLVTHEGEQADFWIGERSPDRRASAIQDLIARLKSESPDAGPYWLLPMSKSDEADRKFGDVRAMLTEAGVPFEETPVDDLPLWIRPSDDTPIALLTLYPERPRRSG